jgi:hypothetical protein
MTDSPSEYKKGFDDGCSHMQEDYKAGERLDLRAAEARIAELEGEVQFLCSLCIPHGGESTTYKPVKFMGFAIEYITQVLATERKRINDTK